MATKDTAVKKSEDKSLGKYFRGVRSEFKKVVWPTKKQVLNYSAIVIIVSIVIALLLSAYDKIVIAILRLILG